MLLRMLLLGTIVMTAATAKAADTDTRVYEMRIYWAAEGKLDALNARFRDHTTKLFEKHGMTNVGYWVPLENPDRKLIYFLAYPSRDAREKSWKDFLADPQWQKAHRESEANGKLVDKVESRFLQPTDYSPAVKPSNKGERIFVLRTYTTTPGNLGALNDRFRNHTLKLFEKHGMTNVVYWTLMSDQVGADKTLVYILAHASKEAADKSFAAFRSDPDWVAARNASEAGGSLTEKDGVKSLFMRATDYSPIQ
ncbi:MAG TPA: NIPSNAP family protein [Pirellulales bacterium]|nr:NIPSNAP family protein [Pirellulales bacterium]